MELHVEETTGSSEIQFKKSRYLYLLLLVVNIFAIILNTNYFRGNQPLIDLAIVIFYIYVYSNLLYFSSHKNLNPIYHLQLPIFIVLNLLSLKSMKFGDLIFFYMGPVLSALLLAIPLSIYDYTMSLRYDRDTEELHIIHNKLWFRYTDIYYIPRSTELWINWGKFTESDILDRKQLFHQLEYFDDGKGPQNISIAPRFIPGEEVHDKLEQLFKPLKINFQKSH